MEKISLSNVDYNDKRTWDLINSGNTVGIFQLDSTIGSRVAKMVCPRSVVELGHVIALQRPPCLIKDELGESILDKYCKIKWGGMDEIYIHEDLKPILSGTLSLIIFQEQVIEIAHKMAGYTLEEADILRAAVGKKKAKVLAAEKEKFINGVIKNGYFDNIATNLWSLIEKSAAYLFNLSHAIEYAYLTYQTAYLKANYPTEFLTSLLTFSKYEPDKEVEIEKLYNEGKRLGIELLPPSIYRLNEDFEITGKRQIAFGLSHIKGIGEANIRRLKKDDKYKKYLNNFDNFIIFLDNSRVSSNVVKALILSGAMDDFNKPRKYMYNTYNAYSLLTNREKEMLIKNEDIIILNEISTLLEGGKVNKRRVETLKGKLNDIKIDNSCGDEYQLSRLLLDEKKYLNITLSGSLVDCLDSVNKRSTHNILDISTCFKNEKISVGGVIEDIREILTKKKERMAFVSISDSTYKTDVIIFPRVWARYDTMIKKGDIILVHGFADSGKIKANIIEIFKLEK